MNKKISILVGVFILFAALVLLGLASRTDVKRQTKKEPVATFVETLKVKTGNIPYQIEVTGITKAKNKIAIYSEVQGKMRTSTLFRVGNSFQKGDLLLAIENREQKVQVQSAKSNLVNQIATMLPDMEIEFPEAAAQWEKYLLQFDFEQPLKPLPEIQSTKIKLFIHGKNILRTFYEAKQLEERLFKYNIFAPFKGALTETNINPGGLVRSGQLLGEYMNTEVFEIELSLPVNALDFVKINTSVRLASLDGIQQYSGKITRINRSINAETQTINTIVEINDNRLKDGQYLNCIIKGKALQEAYTLHTSLIAENQYVYTIESEALTLQRVIPLNYFKDSVTVSGLKDNISILKEPIANPYPGMKVKITSSHE